MHSCHPQRRTAAPCAPTASCYEAARRGAGARMFVVSRTPLYAGRSLLIVAITAAFSVSASEANPPSKTPSTGSAQEGGGRVPEAVERVAIGETIRSQLPSLQECSGGGLGKIPLLQAKFMCAFQTGPA